MRFYGARLARRFRRDIDYATPLLASHVGQDCARQADRRNEVEIEDLEPLFVRELVKVRASASSSGVIDQNVYRFESRAGLLHDQPLHFVRLGYVRGDG